MKPLGPNTLIQNRYLIVQLIGKGGMGEVYLAVDQRLGSAIALKRTFFADDAMLGSAFEREAKILARLRHPVLPKVSDHFTENDEQYLVMEHIAGDDLSKRLEISQKPFPVTWVMYWADQLLDALSYLHSHEPPILHRDIKPQNLKLTDENHVVLLDFGLSKNTTGQTNISSVGSGSVVGYTPHYAPMEQIRGTGTKPRSDIYSLSATLYQLMTNVVPADALTRADALLNHDADPLLPAASLNPEISTIVSAVLAKGLQVSQEKRYSTAVDMQKALRQAFSTMQDGMSARAISFDFESKPSEVLGPSTSQSLPAPAFPNLEIIPDSTSAAAVTSLVDGPATSDQLSGSSPPQSYVKTEVILADDRPWASELSSTESNYGDQTPTVDGSVSPIASGNEESGTFPDETLPYFSPVLESEPAEVVESPDAPEYSTSPNAESNYDTIATFTPTDYAAKADIYSSNDANTPPPAYTAVSREKKSSKTLAVMGGIGAVVLLALVAAGAGFFIYNNYFAGGLSEQSTPSPSVEASASPEPTLAGDIDTNVNLEGNVNAELPPTNTNSGNAETVEPTPAISPAEDTNQGVTVTPRSTPAVSRRTPAKTVTRTPPRRTSTPVKPIAKPSILQ
ncbi:MAG: serine/threonine-protein kinase [Pyrinomonadaceae bacterium]